jgi:hypothetical protein
MIFGCCNLPVAELQLTLCCVILVAYGTYIMKLFMLLPCSQEPPSTGGMLQVVTACTEHYSGVLF